MAEIRSIKGKINKIDANLTVGVAGLIIHEDKILLVNNAVSGVWSFPGGHLFEDESLIQAVLREVKEETGLSTKVIDGPIFYQYQLNDSLNLMLFFYKLNLTNKPSDLASINDEINKIQWFKLDEIPTNVYENTNYVISYFTKTSKK